MEDEGDGDTNCNWDTWNNPQMTDPGTKRLRNQRTRRSHSDYSIVKIKHNTDNSPGDLRRLASTQTPVGNYVRTLAWKTLKRVKSK